MIESRIKEIAASKGIRSSYGLQKALDIAPSNALRLWNGEVTRFSVEILDKLCETFSVGVGDLLVYRKGGNVIQNKDSISANTSNVVETPVIARTISKSARGMLSTVEAAERLGVSRKSVNDYIISGKLKAAKGKGNHNYISEIDLQEFINNR